jgi:bifunctional non-homologous end joining protein LigD
MPEAIAQIDFLESTGTNHLRHTKFVGLREDKDPRKGGEGDVGLMHRA